MSRWNALWHRLITESCHMWNESWHRLINESCHIWNESRHAGMSHGSWRVMSHVKWVMSRWNALRHRLLTESYQMWNESWHRHINVSFHYEHEESGLGHESCHMWNQSYHIGMRHGTYESVPSETSRVTSECVMARMNMSHVKSVVSHWNSSWHVWRCPMSNQSCHIGMRHGTYKV